MTTLKDFIHRLKRWNHITQVEVKHIAPDIVMEQEAICSLHSGRKQLESARNPKQEQICIKKHKNV